MDKSLSNNYSFVANASEMLLRVAIYNSETPPELVMPCFRKRFCNRLITFGFLQARSDFLCLRRPGMLVEPFLFMLENQLFRNLTLVFIGSEGKEELINGTWSGMIGQVVNGYADTTSPHITISPLRRKVVDFIYPWTFVWDGYFLINPSSRVPKINILNSMPVIYWVLGALLLGAASVIYSLTGVSGKLERYRFSHTLSNILQSSYALTFLQKQPRRWKTLAQRTLVFVWSLMVSRYFLTILRISYYGQFNQSMKFPNTYVGLSNFIRNNPKYSYVTGSEFEMEFIRQSADKTFRKLDTTVNTSHTYFLSNRKQRRFVAQTQSTITSTDSFNLRQILMHNPHLTTEVLMDALPGMWTFAVSKNISKRLENVLTETAHIVSQNGFEEYYIAKYSIVGNVIAERKLKYKKVMGMKIYQRPLTQLGFIYCCVMVVFVVEYCFRSF